MRPLSFMCDVFHQCSNLMVEAFVFKVFIGFAILIVAIAFAYYLVRKAR